MYNGRFRQKQIETEYGHFDSMSEYGRYLVLLDMERNGALGMTSVDREEFYQKVKENYNALEKTYNNE